MDYALKQPMANQDGIKDFKQISTQIFDNLERQEKTIYGIQDKLHELKNERVPEKGEVLNEPKNTDISDFYSSLQNAIRILEKNNDRLGAIERHLNRLI